MTTLVSERSRAWLIAAAAFVSEKRRPFQMPEELSDYLAAHVEAQTPWNAPDVHRVGAYEYRVDLTDGKSVNVTITSDRLEFRSGDERFMSAVASSIDQQLVRNQDPTKTSAINGGLIEALNQLLRP